MTQYAWPPSFEKVLREHLPLLGPDGTLEHDTPLTDLGLDSLGTVALVVTLEEEFEVGLPDEKLTAQTFATADHLWSALVESGALAAPTSG